MENFFRVSLLLMGISSVAFLACTIGYVYRRVRHYKASMRYMLISLICMIVFSGSSFYLFKTITNPKPEVKMDMMMLDDMCGYVSRGKVIIGDGILGGAIFAGKSVVDGKEYYVFRANQGVLIATPADEAARYFLEAMRPGVSYTLNCKVENVSRESTAGSVIWGVVSK